ncbi:hypothetical protein B4U80_11952 [Leptotrombidium deliense]|uniref:Uncharacterized protein n=1 Tax=Leptotrombidium deliense TaxID=299467 RepID=A0A443S0G5_9ACAR|nr:hypothetical protein B4U80_11952 [Leptotrombidium deliense]
MSDVVLTEDEERVKSVLLKQKHHKSMSFIDVIFLAKNLMKNVTDIWISGNSCQKENCCNILRCFPNLESISFGYTNLTDSIIASMVEKMRNLKCLQIEHFNRDITGELLASIPSQFECLHIHTQSLNVDVLLRLPHSPALRKFYFKKYGDAKIDCHELATFLNEKVRNLSELTIQGNLTNFDFLTTISSLALQTLRLWYSEVHDFSLETKLTKIELLKLEYVVDIDDKFISKFVDVKTLYFAADILDLQMLSNVELPKLCKLELVGAVDKRY